jgi:formate C-acetyltransferase
MVKYLLEGENRAQIYNDDVCLPAIMNGGVQREDAAMYMAGGCMEISPQGMNCDLNFARTHNIAKVLELVLNGGVDLLSGEKRIPLDRDLMDYTDFEELYGAFEAELAREYNAMVKALDVASECYAEYRPCYLLSSLMNDCLERGKEQQAGGSRYHDYGFAPLGITSAADSLVGIKRAVFDQKFVSAFEMLDALRTNFEGYETLRARLRRLPMFGVEDPEADGMTQRVLRSVCTLATLLRTRFDGRLKPMVFNFVWTPGASAELGARGDGSLAGETIGHGMTPIGRAMKEGITTAINSSTSLPFECVTGGATTMWDMDDQWINHDRMNAILTTFLMKGGMIFQGNTTSIEELEAAMRNPERYPNLIVRVGGFSARFVMLGADLQREIVNRRRHSH